MKIIRNPKPGTKFPSPIEKSGYWKVPKGCYVVGVADATNYPIYHCVRSGK